MKPIACWHHGDLDRLLEHLRKSRIDLYGRNEKTEKGTPRLNHWWGEMRLKPQDEIRIVVGGKIIAYAIINSEPKDLRPDEVEGIWGTYVELDQINLLPEPYPSASCKGYQGSHRFDGRKTSLLDH